MEKALSERDDSIIEARHKAETLEGTLALKSKEAEERAEEVKLKSKECQELSSKLLKRDSELSSGSEETTALKKELDSLRAESDSKDAQGGNSINTQGKYFGHRKSF